MIAPVAASAETAILLAAGGEARIPAVDRERAEAVLVELLEHENVRVIKRAEAERRFRRAPALRCNRTDCALELARTVGADLVAGVALWPEPGEGRAATAVVSLVDLNGNVFDSTAEVRATDLVAAVGRAFGEARGRLRRGPGPWLLVEGEPIGAVVQVDGTDEGVVPWQGRVVAGEHEIQVRLAGHRDHVGRVRVAEGAGTEVRLDVHLDRDAEPSALVGAPLRRPASPPHRRERGGQSYLWPVLLGGAGLAGVAVAGTGLLMPDACEREAASGTCLSMREPDEPVIAAYGTAGLVAIAAAIVWFVLDAPDPEERSRGAFQDGASKWSLLCGPMHHLK